MTTTKNTSGSWARLSRRRRRFAWTVLILLVLGVVFAGVASAQPSTMPGDILTAYRGARAPAVAVFGRYAGRLFRALALVEMAWVGVLLVLERTDLQGFTAGLLRKLLVLFAFFWLLQNGVDFSDRIMNSLTQIGQETAGLPPGVGVSPGNVFYRGVEIAVNMATSSAITGFLINPALSAVVIISCLLVFLSFCVVTVNLIMAMVESYIVVSAGLIFLGFGGNTITRPYVERYFALSVAVGVKLMILYVVVGIGNVLTAGWAAQAATLSTSLFPYQLCLDMLGGSIIFAVVAWGVPKFAASLLSGSPAFSGGDIIGMGMNVVSGGLMVAGGAALAARGAAMVVGGGAARLAAASSVSGSGAGAAGGTTGGAGGGAAGGVAGGAGGTRRPGSGGGNPGAGSGRDGAPYAPGQPGAPGPAGSNGANGSMGAAGNNGGAGDGQASQSASSGPTFSAGAPSGEPASSSGAGVSSHNAPVRSSSEGALVATGRVNAAPPLPSAAGGGSGAPTVAAGGQQNNEGAGAPGVANVGAGANSSGPVAGAANVSGTPGGAGTGAKRQAGQVAPPSRAAAMENVAKVAKQVETGAMYAQKAAQGGLMLAYFMQRVLPHEGGGHGSPPQANMHGD